VGSFANMVCAEGDWNVSRRMWVSVVLRDGARMDGYGYGDGSDLQLSSQTLNLHPNVTSFVY